VGSSLDTALRNHNTPPADLVNLSDRDKTGKLITILDPLTSLTSRELKALAEKELTGLSSLILFYQNTSTTEDLATLTPVELRVLVERKAIDLNPKQSTILASTIGLMSDQDVVLLACGVQDWYAQDDFNIGVSEGCYSGSKLGQSTGESMTDPLKCLAKCRSGMSSPYPYSGIESGICKCCKTTKNLGTRTGSGPDCSDTETFVHLSGIGYPTDSFSNPVASDQDSVSAAFDPSDIDGVGISDNELLGIQEVIMPNMTDTSAYFLAVYKFAVALFKINRENKEELTYEYLHHLRWDMDNYQENSTSWLMEFEKVDEEGTSNYDVPNATIPIDLQGAATYALVPMFVTLPDTFETERPVNWSDRNSFTDPTNLAGIPYPGGKWFNQLIIFHQSSWTSIPNRFLPEVSVLRIVDDKLHHLMPVHDAEDTFGSFYLSKGPDKNPVVTASRLLGRKSFVFVGSNNEMAGISSVQGYKLTEETIPITAYAAFGRVVMGPFMRVESFNVAGIDVVESITSPFLVVLDRDQMDGSHSRLRVFKLLRNNDDVEQIDELLLSNVIYTQLELYTIKGVNYALLLAPSKSLVLKVTRRGLLLQHESDFFVDGSPDYLFPHRYGVGDHIVFPALVQDGTSDYMFNIYDEAGTKLSINSRNVSPDSAYAGFTCLRAAMCVAGSNSSAIPTFDIFSFKINTLPKVDDKLLKFAEWDTLESRISVRVDNLNKKFIEHNDKTKKILLHSGTTLSGNWTLGDLTVVNRLSLPSDALDSSTLNLHVRSKDEVQSVDYTDSIHVSLSEVESRQTALLEALADFSDLSAGLRMDTTEDQMLSKLVVGVLEADQIVFGPDNVTLHTTEIEAGDSVELVESLLPNLYRLDTNRPIYGNKRFSGSVAVNTLKTEKLSKGVVEIVPEKLLLNAGDQRSSNILFKNKVKIENFHFAENAGFVDKTGSVKITPKDLLDNDLDKGIYGYYSFVNKTEATEVSSDLDTLESINLTKEIIPRIVKTGDDTSMINGTLIIDLGHLGTATGAHINVVGGIVNNFDLKDLVNNVATTHCTSLCLGKTVTFKEKITANGKVTANEKVSVSKVNGEAVGDYVRKIDFPQPRFAITGKKVLKNSLHTDTLKSDDFSNYTLDSMVTKNSPQRLQGLNTFQQSIIFHDVDSVNPDIVPEIDGKDFMKVFKSNLMAIRDLKPWVNQSIDSDVHLSSVKMRKDSTLKVAQTVNGMAVPSVLSKVIKSTDESVALNSEKIFGSEVHLQDVVTLTVDNGNETRSTDYFVNTRTQKTISGRKTFKNGVKFRDIFLVDQAKINNIDFSKVLSCFVDIKSDMSKDIDIRHPISFDKIIATNFILQKNPDLFISTCPPDLSVASAVQLVTDLDDLAPYSEDDLLSELENGLSTFGLNIGGTTPEEKALDAIIAFLLNEEQKWEPQLNASDINNLTLDAKRDALKMKIRNIFGLSVFEVASLSDLELVHTLCGKPLMNEMEPSQDFALIDGDNVFGSEDSTYVQNMDKTTSFKMIKVHGNVNMIANRTVFGEDINLLDQERFSLTRSQFLDGQFDFSDIRLQSDGTFNGHVIVQHGDQNVSSETYKPKFLNFEDCSETQKFTAHKKVHSLDVDSLQANSLKVTGKEDVIDIPSLYANGIATDRAEVFDSLDFLDNVDVMNPITLDGTVDEVVPADLARDIVIHGDTVQVSSDLSITGTNAGSIRFEKVKVLMTAPTVGTVTAFVEDDKVWPEVIFKPCSRSNTFAGAIEGNVALSLVVPSFEKCHQECRKNECAAISYSASTGVCRVMSTTVKVVTETDFVSAVYQCWFQVQSSETKLFLSMDPENNTLITREEPDFWLTDGELMIHRASGLAASGNSLNETGVPVQLVPADPTDKKQAARFTANLDFQIFNVLSGSIFEEGADGIVRLEDPALVVPSNWTAGFGGERLVKLDDGKIVTRMFTKSTEQDLSGHMRLHGNVVFTSEVGSDEVGGLKVEDIAAKYDHDVNQGVHQVYGDMSLTGSVAIGNLDGTTFHGRSFNDFLADALPSTSSRVERVSGAKKFLSPVEFGAPIVVQSSVAGFDLLKEKSETAFINEDAVFTKLNTFEKSDDIDNKLTIVDKLSSKIGVTIASSQIKDGQNMVEMVQRTIPRTGLFEPVSVDGKITFTQDVTSGDINIGSLANTDLPGADTFSVPEDILLTSAASVSTNVDGLERTFKGIKADMMEVQGEMLGHDPDEFLNVFYKDGDQNCSAPKRFLEEVRVKGDIELDSLNDMDPSENLVQLDTDNELHGKFRFTQLTAQKIDLNGSLDGFDFLEMVDNIFTLDDPQTIEKRWNISSSSEFLKDVVGNNDPLDGEGQINNQKVSDLKAVKNIYDRVQAVKVSAQAEATTMCEFVEDVQDSYLANQGIRHYDIVTTYSPEGSNFLDVELIFASSVGRFFVAALDEAKLVILEQSGDEIVPVSSLDLPEEYAVTQLKISSHLDLSGNSTSEFDMMVFLAPGVGYNTTLMYRFTGSDSTSSLDMVGELRGVSAIFNQNGGDVFLLQYVTVDDQHFESRLSLLDIAHLLECGSDCSNVTTNEFWRSEPKVASPGSDFTAKLDVSKQPDTTNLAIAFTEPTDGFADYVVRLVYATVSVSLLERKYYVVQMVHATMPVSPLDDSGDDPVLQRQYSARDLAAIGVPKADFCLLTVHDRVLLYSADETAVRVEEVDLATGAKVATSNINLPGRMRYFSRQLNYLGDFNYLTVVMDSQSVVDLKYAGVRGLEVLRKIDIDSEILCMQRLNFVRDQISESYVVTAGGNRITLIKGRIHNNVKQLEFDCPNPEISPALIWNEEE